MNTNKETGTYNLRHVFTFGHYGDMTGEAWMGKGGHFNDFNRDEVEHSVNCHCGWFTPTTSEPPF